MSRTLTTVTAARFHDLADTLTRNAEVLRTAGLPEVVVSVRATVYCDVAAQLRLLAEAEPAVAEGNPLVLVREDGPAVARRFEMLAGGLAANARVLTCGTSDAVMRRRAGVYRDVAAQVRLLAEAEREAEMASRRRTSRPPLSNLAGPCPVAAKAAVRAPRVRPEFLDALVAAIARRRAQGWSVARLTLWLRTTLRDPQTGAAHPCAERSFVSYVTALLAGPAVRAAA
ncbi:hypothetical protein AMES_6081 [Amycolatopsis mediterranei S699]|uniref:Uncharacterized protein n=2 Tax=Amycolatopsis mediterranei TaxID=33910 RepID=A0A9R0UBG8_AMYMS|nr:hypothetical protein [Amycolatopsis mediterranei]AEK44801.1 hypothetical protein RAM_31630 [Amycolatopsis mediterranei S699]AFO79617.1 hypothetical protein AMES_6081 [Amycolatopsis mediterranei S699]AGT86745.1 hypothetical protein B737_6081 [Amycolatopsis mediterranei RB]KDO11013.1 hypothetical protein DV26_09735 [Amycolatopsis mediterranei]KDU87203.1 hypothetical protein DV36_36645 [Amycolatopsis mediterranei]